MLRQKLYVFKHNKFCFALLYQEIERERHDEVNENKIERFVSKLQQNRNEKIVKMITNFAER